MVPKILGADVELSNFLFGPGMPAEGTGREASRCLLAAIDGVPGGQPQPQAIDSGRKYLPSNGSCCYLDSDHLEIALPETRSAFDHVAQWRAMLAVARAAKARVEANLPSSVRLQVLANCSDGQGNSYGSHVNVLLTREAWDNIFYRRPHYLAYLAAFQISSIVITGQGKVGAERHRSAVEFQLSQRADFIETLVSVDTMVHRGVVNSRDEPLCGSPRAGAHPRLARLHVIFFDSTLCQVATVLRAGMLQMVVAMIEAGAVNAALALDDPLDALERFSRDPALRATARLAGGGRRTAVELQWSFLEEAKRFSATGGFDGLVPDADRLLALWEDTLVHLERRNFDTLSRRLDWVLKRRILESVLDRRLDLTWRSPALKHLDQLYASLDEQEGPFWALEVAGKVDRVVDAAAIALAGREPPADTRAWTRAHLLRLAGEARVDLVDWDRVRVRVAAARPPYARYRTVHMPEPYRDTRDENARLFAEGAPLAVVVAALRSAEWLPPAVVSVVNDHWTTGTGGLQ
jgi:proteasome accessory factor A